jgi:hypothetical protein
MRCPRLAAHLSFTAICLIAGSIISQARAVGDNWNDWRPIDPAHLAQKEPVVEKDADAEALFWEVRVADELEGASPRTVLSHYIRIKIFTERGRESQSRIDIPFGKVLGREIKIKDIAGRTIKPDGSIIELKKDDVYERTIIKASGLKVKAKSFAMPGVEPGAIIEYRWREVRGDQLSMYDRLELSREIPVQSVKYYIKPFTDPLFPYGMRIKTFYAQTSPFAKEKNGFFSTSLTNVPAFRAEPHMPPEYAVRPWMLVYYSEDRKLQPDQYWKDYGKRVYERTRSLMKVNDEVRRAAADIIGDAQMPEQKLERLFDFCRAKIKRIYDDASGLTAEERAKLKENRSPSDTLKRGMGTDLDIDTLFAALATAAGFEARVYCTYDREDIYFDKGFPDDYFIDPAGIAVRVGDGWRFYNPASTYVPHGMLRWQEEGQEALIADPREPVWTVTPLSAPERSMEKRTARLSLGEDGTLEGDVRIEYTGHLAVEMKEYNDDDSPAEREETLRNRIKARMSTAEVSNISIENVTDPIKPFVYSFHVRVPGYAQRTGKRLFLQPAFFQFNVAPRFPTSARRHEIYFHYPWSEQDEVSIKLPDGFVLDNPDAPARFGAGQLSQYDVTLGLTKDNRTLIYKRKFFFGGGGRDYLRLRFPATAYDRLKIYFDELNKQDNHVLSLKQSATASAPSH